MIKEMTEDEVASFVRDEMTQHFKDLFLKYMETQYGYKADTKERVEYFNKVCEKYTKEMNRLAKARLIQDYSLKAEFKYTNITDAPDIFYFAKGYIIIGKFLFRQYNHPQMDECGIKGFYIKGNHPLNEYNFGTYRLCHIKGKTFKDFDNDIIKIGAFASSYMKDNILPYMRNDFEKFISIISDNKLF